MAATTATLERFLPHADLSCAGEEPESLRPLYQQALEQAEARLDENPLDEEALRQLQQLYREQEQWIASSAVDERHHFVIAIPVADRPQQLQQCLQSLYELCNLYHYGRDAEGHYQKLTLLICDDSLKEENREQIRTLTEQSRNHGIESIYFGSEAQERLLEQYRSGAEHDDLEPLLALSNQPDQHRGASATRNLAYLKLNQLSKQWGEQRRPLFWFVDSDQAFRVNLYGDNQQQECYCINYLYLFDQLFRQHDAVMMTGKLVGDPPVSPTVMANNLLLDLNHFLQTLSTLPASAPCQFHQSTPQREGEAAYHDMTDLFGYPVPPAPYRYRCDLEGAHNHYTALHRFIQRLTSFFYGEHPTRRSYYQRTPLMESVGPARTVYTANYLFTPEGLDAFIPFATLKLRMAGPMLGRFLQQRLGNRFLSANLPMVHKRTLEQADHAEHRPGVKPRQNERGTVDLSVEFERQFYGDVALFAIEKLTDSRHEGSDDLPSLLTLLEETEQRLRHRYQQQREQIASRLEQFEALWSKGWWYQHSSDSEQQLTSFIDNLRHNFLQEAPAWSLIESSAHRQQRLQQIAEAIHHYPEAQEAWSKLLQRW